MNRNIELDLTQNQGCQKVWVQTTGAQLPRGPSGKLIELLELELISWWEEEAFNRFSISFEELVLEVATNELIRWEEVFNGLSIPVAEFVIKQEEEFNRFSISFVELVLELMEEVLQKCKFCN